MVNYSSRTIGFCVKIVYLVDIFDTGPDPAKTEKFVTQPVPTHGRTRPMSSCALYRVNILRKCGPRYVHHLDYAYKRSVSTTTESRCCRNRVTSLYDRPPTRYSFMILYRLARDVTSVTCTGTRGAPVEPSVAVRHASTNTHDAWRLSVTAAGYIRRSCCMTSHASVADDLVRNVYCALTSVK